MSLGEVSVPRSFAADFAYVTGDWADEERELARSVARDALRNGDLSPIETFRIVAAELRDGRKWG